MNHKDFMAAAQNSMSHSVGVTPPVDGWAFTSREHVVDQYPMSLVWGTTLTPELNIGTVGHYRYRSENRVHIAPILVGSRQGANASDIEVAFGLYIDQNLHSEHRHKMMDFGECGYIYCGATTPPGHPHTARVRVRWELATGTTKPNVSEFRVRSMIGYDSDHYVHVYRQLPPNHEESSSGGEVDESAISGRTAAFAATDKMHIAIPWLHENNELLVTMSLKNLHTAVASLKTLLTPTPAPTDD